MRNCSSLVGLNVVTASSKQVLVDATRRVRFKDHSLDGLEQGIVGVRGLSDGGESSGLMLSMA